MIQAKLGQTPAPPPPAAPGVTVVTPRALAGPPVTAQDVAALKARRSELSDQLNSAANRRHEIARQLQSATGANKSGLEQRMGVLDARIARLETDIAETGEQLSSAPYASVAQQEDYTMSGNRLADIAVPILVVFTIFVLCPLALAWARSIWKRGSVPRAAVDQATSQRLERMEQAMDAIAIEVERVSEGQRFITRLFSEGKAGLPLGAGERAMEPIPVPAGEKVSL
jgi:hypothetical protein